MILPHLMYCNIVWENYANYLLNRIHILQKRAVRINTNSEPYTYADHVFKNYLYKIRQNNNLYVPNYRYNVSK